MNEIDKSSSSQDITIIANDRAYTLPVGSSVATLLNSLNITARYVVVRMDGIIISRPDYASTALQPDCKLEVISIVGGG